MFVVSLVTFSTLNNILNSQNGSSTKRWQRQSESKPVTDRRGETPAAPLALSLITHVDCVSACLPVYLTQNDKTHNNKKISYTAAPAFSTHMLHLSPLCNLVASILCCIILPVCLSLCCISLAPSRSVFIPVFLCTHWPCSGGVQCSYRRVWVGMLVTQWAPWFT